MTLSEAQARRLIQLYTAAELEITKEYNRALLKGNDLKNLAALKRNIGIIRQDLLAGARTWTEEAIPMLYKTAMVDVDGALGLSGVGYGGIHQRALQILAENTYQRFVDVDQVVGRRADDVYRNLALETIRGDIVGFQTWKQVAKAYREKLAEKGVTGFRDAAGRDWDLRRYTEMVARTTTREVMIQGTANRLLEHGHDLAVITGGIGSNTCEICKAWVGRTVSLTGKTPGYPTLEDARAEGLLHPNCTHNIATAMTFEGEIAKARYAADPEKKAQLAIEEGERFWSGLTEDAQISIYKYTDRKVNAEINNYLYNNAKVDDEIKYMAEQLGYALKQASLPDDMILYRGISPDIWDIMKADPGYVTPGDEVTLKGFISSTYDRGRAWKYASETLKEANESAVIEILAPRGAPALSVERRSQSPEDKEVLFNSGTKFKVIEARKDGNVMRLVWEVIL